MERFEQGDAWGPEGVNGPINFASHASAGIALPDRSAWVRWDDIRPGGYEPKARLWPGDFPHGGSDWPSSVRVIHADFADIPARERDLILAGNAQRIYRFGL